MNEREREIIEVSLDDIIPNRFQPRLSFDEQGLNELAESIRQHGIIQPLVLRKIGDKYEIIAGERRYKASYIAGLTKVPAVIIDLNDNESAEVAIVENIQRKDLSPIEEAKSYKKLLDRGYLTQDQLASRMGKNQSTVSNKLRLLNLDEKVQDALLNNKISERHARSLLKLDNKEEQKEVLDKIIEKRLNVRDTEDLINRKLNGEEEFINIPNLSNTGIEETFDSNNIPNISNDYKNEEEIEKMPTFSSNPIKEYKENDDDIEVISDFDNDIINVPSLSIAKKEKNIDDVISKIQRVVEEVKELGFEAKLEEYDFDGLYQFVIKVDNEN
ncbi:parB-like partition protein [Clostridium sp. CAG:433]|nr:parB-like partition protein [Clostridium sp. CAG:433]